MTFIFILQTEHDAEERLIKKIVRSDCLDQYRLKVITIFYPKENPIGYLDYKIIDDSIELLSVYVSKKNRVKGVGRKLVEMLIEIANTKNIKIIYTVSDCKENTTFDKFIRILGFEKEQDNSIYYKRL